MFIKNRLALPTWVGNRWANALEYAMRDTVACISKVGSVNHMLCSSVVSRRVFVKQFENWILSALPHARVYNMRGSVIQVAKLYLGRPAADSRRELDKQFENEILYTAVHVRFI